MICAENNPPYSRILTPEYMTAEVKEEDLFWRGTDFYNKHQVETLLGRMVLKVLPEKSMGVLDNQETISYDQLLIAPGSRPVVPAWVDQDIKGVFTLWDKMDSEKTHTDLAGVSSAVSVGGGLVGLQAARAFIAVRRE